MCSVHQAQIAVDFTRATLQDLVQDVLRGELGYGEELTVNNDIGTLYDPELDENVTKRFDELGLQDQDFLTIVDDEDESPRVNLSLSIIQKLVAPSITRWYNDLLQELSRRLETCRVVPKARRSSPSSTESPN